MISSDHRPLVAAQRRERMRSRLMAAALALATEPGVEAVSIDAVITRAGVARGTFYKYFDTPAALMQEVGLEVSDALIRAMNPVMSQMLNPAERISAGVRTVLRLAREHPQVGGYIVRSGWPAMDVSHAFFTLVGNDLEKAIQQGFFEAMPLELALSAIAGTTIGAMHAIMTAVELPEDFPEQTAEAVLRALGLPSEEAIALARANLPIPVMDVNSLFGSSRK
jgi:TetR/AcrR family transcriptional regulator, ethionamide resistance regulator